MRTVLIADDTALARDLLRTVVGVAGDLKLVAEAQDGQEAIELAELHRPDIIVLDHQMPRCTGLQALPALRALCPSAHIIIWSGEPGLRTDAMAAGADGLVDKQQPVTALLAALGIDMS